MPLRALVALVLVTTVGVVNCWGGSGCQSELRTAENLRALVLACGAGRSGLTTAVPELLRIAKKTRNPVVRTVSWWAIVKLSPRSSEAATTYIRSFPGVRFCECLFDLELVIPELQSSNRDVASDLLETLVGFASKGDRQAMRTLFAARSHSDASCSQALDGWLIDAFVASSRSFARAWAELSATSRERIVDALGAVVSDEVNLRLGLQRGVRSQDTELRAFCTAVLRASK